MAFGIGPSPFWMRTKEAADYYAIRCPVATTLGDGSRIFCKTGGRAWIVAPSSTEVGMPWAGGQYNSTCVVADKCCISEWNTLCTRLLSCCFNPCDWFVPSQSVLQSAYTCRSNWDYCNINSTYWSSTENVVNCGCGVNFFTNCITCSAPKNNSCLARAFRCVTY